MKGLKQAEIVTLLRRSGRSAFVSRTRDGTTVIYDRGSEASTCPEELGSVASLLSDRFRCPALTAAIYDDDDLLLALFESGIHTSEYNSTVRRNVRAERLCKPFAVPVARLQVWAVLSLPHLVPYVFETTRHRHLFRALGLPEWAVGTGYRYIQTGGASARPGQIGLEAHR